MKTPFRHTLEEFSLSRAAWIRDHCHDEEGFQVCNHCKAKVELLGAYISIHDWRFGDSCAGSGKVVRLAIPFCPTCEQRPEISGCIHEIEPHWDGGKDFPSKPFTKERK